MILIPGKSDEENVKEMMHILGVTEEEARFILAVEKGEIDGDEGEETIAEPEPPAT